jgi:hypothetical protein
MDIGTTPESLPRGPRTFTEYIPGIPTEILCFACHMLPTTRFYELWWLLKGWCRHHHAGNRGLDFQTFAKEVYVFNSEVL